MADPKSLGESLRHQGVSRRGFLKYCAATASMMALPPSMVPAIASALEKAQRPSVIWLSFQECTGCTESLTRSHAPTVESLIFDYISLDYHHTLQAAAGEAAELAREQAMHDNQGKYLLVVDGSIPLAHPEFSTIAGISNLEMLRETVAGAAAVVAVEDIVKDKPIINVPGCPPVPVVISGVLAHYLTFGALPELDEHKRPLAFYGQSIHDRCYRRPFYDKGLFAETFDDAGAKAGWCLYRLGCKGPMTYNACATVKWNQGTSWPVESGHPCLGCSEPNLWDAGGFDQALSIPTSDLARTATYAAAAGVAVGTVSGMLGRSAKQRATAGREAVNIDDLEKSS